MKDKKSFDLKKTVVGTIFIVLIIAVIYLQKNGYFSMDVISEYIRSQGYVGWIIFVGIYAIGTTVAFPGSILTLIAGFVFNSLLGFILVLIGASIGALLAFLVSRNLFQDYFQRKFSNTKFLRWTKTENQKTLTSSIFIMRLLPIFPFNFLNYVSGLTKITTKRYFLATIFGIIPGTFVYVFLGSSLNDIFSLKFLGAILLTFVFSFVATRMKNKTKFSKF